MIELTSKQLRRAAQIKDKIESLQSDLNRLLGGGGVPGNGRKEKKAGPKRKNKMSAAGRAKIAAAQKARWAKIKAGKK